jgi:hypothetical protein
VPKPKRKISDARKEAEKSKKTTDVIAIEYDPERNIGIVATLPAFHDLDAMKQLDVLSDTLYTLTAYYRAKFEQELGITTDEAEQNLTATRH